MALKYVSRRSKGVIWDAFIIHHQVICTNYLFSSERSVLSSTSIKVTRWGWLVNAVFYPYVYLESGYTIDLDKRSYLLICNRLLRAVGAWYVGRVFWPPQSLVVDRSQLFERVVWPLKVIVMTIKVRVAV